MPGLVSNAAMRVRRSLMKRAMARGGGSGNPDLTSLRRVPRRATYPLRRDGIDPVQRLRDVQAKEPVTRVTRLLGMNVWLVTGYDEARAVLADSTNYSNNIRHLLGAAERSGANEVGGLGMTDPPDHTKLPSDAHPGVHPTQALAAGPPDRQGRPGDPRRDGCPRA
ncbi:MAG: hypothetical protein QM714_12745 [Nocardioides sp.]|uniref:hypothetical protein n=1 Tax=Nocardioides sp. TaxID=35761 RepID=UPI0039E421AC